MESFAKELFEQERKNDSQVIAGKAVTVEEGMVTLYLTNNLQKDRLQHFQAEVLKYLRSKTGYEPLDLQTKVEAGRQQEEGSKRVYTQQEKFRYLADKNPAMNTLKEKFDLQIDY